MLMHGPSLALNASVHVLGLRRTLLCDLDTHTLVHRPPYAHCLTLHPGCHSGQAEVPGHTKQQSVAWKRQRRDTLAYRSRSQLTVHLNLPPSSTECRCQWCWGLPTAHELQATSIYPESAIQHGYRWQRADEYRNLVDLRRPSEDLLSQMPKTMTQKYRWTTESDPSSLAALY